MSVVGPREEGSFWIVPPELHGDRYLQDLLQNHAPDLEEAKKRVEELHSQFTTLRKEFEREFTAGITREADGYRLEPGDYFTRWIFELLVKEERGVIEDSDQLREHAMSKVKEGQIDPHPDEPRVVILIKSEPMTTRTIYSGVFDQGDQKYLNRYQSQVRDDVVRLINDILKDIDKEPAVDFARQGADTLDEATEAVSELEKILIEYEGRPIYPGDCKYLKEARIESG